MSSTTITPKELYDKLRAGTAIELIDVRTPVEFREVHAVGARNVPLDTLTPEKLLTEPGSKGTPVYMICRSGGRAAQACERMVAAGFADVVNVEGGTLAWVEAGLPIVRDHKVISLERQVRIAAGSLVLIGALLGFFVHPYWIALSAFVGAGLVFAGLTNTCGMGLLLAKMPWNRAGGNPGASCSVKSGSCSLRK